MNSGLDDVSDVVTLVRRNAAALPDQDALVFVADPDDPHDGAVRWSYQRLDHEARGCAEWLQRHLPVGSRVLLLQPNGLEFAAAFLGCLYAGMIAVPSPLPGTARHHRNRVAVIAGNAGVSAVLTAAAQLAEIQDWAAAAELTDVLVAANDAPGFGDPEQWRPVPVDRTTTAFLQYTSGSTGDPKGVVVSHDNILYNLAAVTAEASWSASMRMGGWLPVYHDMGILGVFLCPILNGGTSVMLTPMSFIRKPVRWLQAIQRYDINVSFAPSFAYDLCVRKVSDADVAELDLSGWHLAGNASEPVNPATIAAFVEKFGPAGFRPETFAPIYGLAELTAYVCGHRGRPARITTVDLEQLAQGRFVADPDQGTPGEVVSCGPPTRACEIRVVDPASRQVLPEGQLGEVWLRGRSVASGYWKHPATAQVFGVSTADREAGFLRTGDLGVMYDGELYLHGRIKDTLIVNGRNIYPHDVEHELREQHPELGNFGAVFAGAQLPHAGDGPLVVAHEVGRVEQGRLPSLATEMRLTVGREFGVPVAAVVLLRAGSVLRTTSGKIRRSAMREQFCSGAMKVLYSDRPVSAAVGASPDATP